MNISDLQTTESLKIGDTIISANDLSLKYIDRTNIQYLNKIEYPKLWELYKKSTGDRFVDKNIFSTDSATQKIDFIKTENSYMVLQSPTTVNLKFYNNNLNLLSTKSSGISASSVLKKICGDNQYVLICDSGSSTNVKLNYSTNFNIDNQIVGTFTEKTLNNRVNICFVNNNFIISVLYSSETLFFKLNKTNLSRISEITGVFATDSLLDFVLINSVTFLSTNNLSLTTFSLTSINIIFLENEDIYIYNNTDKKIVKTTQSNPYFLELYENLVSDITTGDISSFSYYKNSFIMSFTRLSTSGSIIIIINDNGQKIKNDSLINTNIQVASTDYFRAKICYTDFINKRIIMSGVSKIVFYDNFSMNNTNTNVFSLNVNNSSIFFIGNQEYYTSLNNIFINKNATIMRLTEVITLENGSNQYDNFRADFIKGTFPDNFTMPAIVGNTKDKYWTKKG